MIKKFKKIIKKINYIEKNYDKFKHLFIETRNLKTVELKNLNIKKTIKNKNLSNKINKFSKIKPPHINDEIERNNFLSKIDYLINKYLIDDIYSRRIVIQQKYNNDEYLASCMSFLQFLIRKNKNNEFELNCYVVMRSQNIENFLYDIASILIYSNFLINKTNLNFININLNIKIISLHKYIKNEKI